MRTIFWLENLEGRHHLEHIGSGWKYIIGSGGVDWTHLAQDRDQWQTVVNTVMNLMFP